jgi:ligand-binding SRPBCC domain-containing protein
MSTAKVFEHRSRFAATPEQMMALHSDPAALYKLTPPPIFIQPLHDERTSITSGEFEFRLWFGPIPIRWLMRHEPGPIPTSFIDRMLRGPMAEWEHRHIFQPVPGGVELIDHLTLAHKSGLPGVFTRLMFDGLPLRFLFIYRHWRTRRNIGRYIQES